MKRIIKFTTLKVLEVAGAALVWWGLSWYGYWVAAIFKLHLNNGTLLEKWLEAPCIGIIFGLFLPAVAIFVSGLICVGIWCWIEWNWKKAGE